MKKNPIGKYLLQNWYYYVFAFGSMALSVFLDMLAPLVTLHIVDDVLVGHKMELLWKYLAAFLLIGAAKALFQYIKRIFIRCQQRPRRQPDEGQPVPPRPAAFGGIL
mgnify:FL=1